MAKMFDFENFKTFYSVWIEPSDRYDDYIFETYNEALEFLEAEVTEIHGDDPVFNIDECIDNDIGGIKEIYLMKRK